MNFLIFQKERQAGFLPQKYKHLAFAAGVQQQIKNMFSPNCHKNNPFWDDEKSKMTGGPDAKDLKSALKLYDHEFHAVNQKFQYSGVWWDSPGGGRTKSFGS